MPSDVDQIRAIKSQTLARIAELTAEPKPTYYLDGQTPLAGHSAVSLAVAGVVYDALQTDPIWTRDAIGYNFRHVLDVSAHAAFPTAGRAYRIVYELTPASGQVILVRFRVHAI
jgi:hypothetical protein